MILNDIRTTQIYDEKLDYSYLIDLMTITNWFEYTELNYSKIFIDDISRYKSRLKVVLIEKIWKIVLKKISFFLVEDYAFDWFDSLNIKY